MNEVAAELRQAQTRLEQLDEIQRPMSVTPKLIRDPIAEMSGLLEHAALDTRVAWVRDLFERIDVDSREERAVAVWRSPSGEGGVNRLDSVSGWLRRAGAGRVVNPLGTAASAIPLPYPGRSRHWLEGALLECASGHQVAERRSPAQRHCPGCRALLRGSRSREAVARARRGHEIVRGPVLE